MRLREVQQLLWRAVTWPNGVKDFVAQADVETQRRFREAFADTEEFGRVDRIEVYAEAYFWRLAGVIGEQYPVVAWLSGQKVFHNLLTDYVLACPSNDPDIHQFGQRFPAYLRSHRLASELPGLPELADVEWALCDVLAGPDEDLLGSDELAAQPLDRWPTLQFVAASTTKLVRSRWDFPALWRAHRDGVDRGSVALESHEPALAVLVWREAYEVFHRGVDPLEARALEAMIAGESFAAICEAAAGRGGEGAAPDQVAGWLRGWLASKLIARIG